MACEKNSSSFSPLLYSSLNQLLATSYIHPPPSNSFGLTFQNTSVLAAYKNMFGKLTSLFFNKNKIEQAKNMYKYCITDQ